MYCFRVWSRNGSLFAVVTMCRNPEVSIKFGFHNRHIFFSKFLVQLARECRWLLVFYSKSCRTHLRPTIKNNLLEMNNTSNNV